MFSIRPTMQNTVPTMTSIVDLNIWHEENGLVSVEHESTAFWSIPTTEGGGTTLQLYCDNSDMLVTRLGISQRTPYCILLGVKQK